MNLDQRQYLERNLAAEASERAQAPADHAEWVSAGYTCRIPCNYDKILVVWCETDDGPRVTGRLRFINLEADTRTGLGVCIESIKSGGKPEHLWVTHSPVRLFGLPMFGHVPFIADVTYTPENRNPEKFTIRFPFVLKTKSNPYHPVVGDTYVSQLGEFRKRFAQFADLVL